MKAYFYMLVLAWLSYLVALLGKKAIPLLYVKPIVVQCEVNPEKTYKYCPTKNRRIIRRQCI